MADSAKPKGKIRRYGFELVVVFLGVWLSLVAESCRQARESRMSIRPSIGLLWTVMYCRHRREYRPGSLWHRGRNLGSFLSPLIGRLLSKDSPRTSKAWVRVVHLNASEYTALRGLGA